MKVSYQIISLSYHFNHALTHSLTPSHLIDINECDFFNVCPNGLCENIEGGYRCKCENGFALSQDGLSCVGRLHVFL